MQRAFVRLVLLENERGLCPQGHLLGNLERWGQGRQNLRWDKPRGRGGSEQNWRHGLRKGKATLWRHRGPDSARRG